MEEDEEPQEPQSLADFESVDEFTKNGFKILVEATKISNALPADRDWNYYKIHDSFNNIVNAEGDKILRLMNGILHSLDFPGNIRNKDVEEKTEMVIEANDEFLEKVANGIDEVSGIKKNVEAPVEIQKVSAQLPVNGSWNQMNKATFTVSSALNPNVVDRSNALKSITLLTAKNIVRPQTQFQDKVDNGNDHPWIPRIKEKPNSTTPLAIFLETSDYGEQYSHPYEYELEHFKPLPEQLKTTTPSMPASYEETPLFEISTPEGLNNLLQTLLNCTEFAVDLEHHSYRTFLGITCLMQISTNEADYLIDTLALRDKLWVLNEVFTKPTIVKVFHGADCDIQWLQRDLSLYVVNMFDTHQAAKLLEYSGLSLAYLLNMFCQIVPNKHFQLADWRIRPLPQELKTYARMDTHYLLYIYHTLKNELLKKANGGNKILLSVLQQSTELCKKRYLKPLLNEESHLEIYHKCKRLFNNKQMYALKELYTWRDVLARTEDESTSYVLPNHMLLQIAEALPREMQGILACCNPIPPLVRSNLSDLHKIILVAREQSVVQPILKEDARSRGITLQFNKMNVDSPFHCPHDLSKSQEFRDDFPVFLNGTDSETSIKTASNSLEKAKSMYSVFNTPDNSDDEENLEEILKIKNIKFLGPYDRYKLVKPFIKAEEEKAAAAAAATQNTTTDANASDLKNREEVSKEPTDEDRIAALHAHFVKVSKETPQKLPNADVQPTASKTPTAPKKTFISNESFVKMGGSKKRKFTVSENEEDDSSCNRHIDQLHTPVPHVRYQNKPKKRKKNNGGIQNEQEEGTNQFNLQLKIKQPQQPNPPKQQNKNKRQRKKQKKNNMQNYQNNQAQNQKFNKAQKNFTPFDYSSVNFQEFQGGASSSAQRAEPAKSRFRGKNKNNRFQRGSGNKSMMFNRQARN